jgi:NTF2 fold immunity protein
MMRIFGSLILAICGISIATASGGKYYVPDPATAIKIAIAFWEPIYGREQVAKNKPFHAKLKNGIWIVDGSLPADRVDRIPVTKIEQNDGRNVRFGRKE